MNTMISIVLVIYAVLYIVGGTILLRSISGFRTRLRVAYIIILAGILIEAMMRLGEAMAQFLNWWDQIWFIRGQLFGYALAALLICAGAYSFGRLLQVRYSLTFFSVALSSGIIVAAGVALPKVAGERVPINFETVVTIVLVWLLIMAMWMLLQVWHQTSQLYKKSVAWLAWAIGLLALPNLLLAVPTALIALNKIMGTDKSMLLMAGLYIISGLALCKAAVEFYIIRTSNLGEFKKIDRLMNSVDILVYAASLASNPRDIDPLLDELRGITASSDAPTSAQEETLRKLYLRLEDYLISRDPVRHYERDMLRELITRKLTESDKTAATFWPSIRA